MVRSHAGGARANPSNARALAFHAHMLTLLGRFEPADRQMDEARHDPNMAFVSVIPFSEKLRNDSRFQELLRRTGLPDLGSPGSPASE